MQIRNERRAGVLLTYLNLMISFIIPMLYTPVMLRLLGQQEYGLYSLSNSIISYLGLLSLGLGSAIVRYLMQCRVEDKMEEFNRMAGLFLMIYILISGVSLLAGLGLTGLTGVIFGNGLSETEIGTLKVLIAIMSVGTVISLIGGVFTSFITCLEKYFFLKLTAVICTIALPVLNLVTLHLGMKSVGLALVHVLLQACICGINVWYCTAKLNVRPVFRDLPVDKLKDIFKYSAFVFIGLIADMLYWATDKVLIGALIGSVAVGVYNVGGTFHSILQNMTSAISNVFTPEVNKMVVKERSKANLSELMTRIGRIQYLIVSLVLSGFAVFGKPFIRFWAGPEYLEAYDVALLTMFPLAIPLIQNIAFTIIKAQGKHQFRSVLYLVLAVANAVSTFFLIPIMGITGAALCTCIVFVLGHGLSMNWFYYKKIGLDIPGFWKNILRMSIVPAVLAVVWMLLKLPIYDLWGMLLQIVIYTAIFCGLSWLFTMNRYEKDLILSLVRKVLPLKGKK